MMKQITRRFGSLNKIFGDEMVDFVTRGGVYRGKNFVGGRWEESAKHEEIPDPLSGKTMCLTPVNSEVGEAKRVISELAKCPKSGLHNPFKDPGAYRRWGDVMTRATMQLHRKEVESFFLALTQRVMPKSESECFKEFVVTRQFVENFGGDNPRFALRGFGVAGDRNGGISQGWRYPFGPCMMISPFNFPIEIFGLQLIGGLIAGNKILVKPDSRVGVAGEALVRLLLHCGMSAESLIFLYNNGPNTEQLIREGLDVIRLLQFTGSSAVAERLSQLLHGKIRMEDSGMNWKILGPDVSDISFVAGQTDQDAFACSGQKCSALRLLFVHENWSKTDFLAQVSARAKQRSYKDRTLSPILTWSNQRLSAHVEKVLAVPGARLVSGGRPVEEKLGIPTQYGTFQPTLIEAPLSAFEDPKHFQILTTEVFAPFVLSVNYKHTELPKVLSVMERVKFHLTAGIVSNDLRFINKILGESVNGVTYAGMRARTTGAPQNHWFGPSNDPRGGGIGTIEAIQHTWTSHREIVFDSGELDLTEQPPVQG